MKERPASQLRVALDATPATTGRTGVARYCLELASALQSLDVDLTPFALGRGKHPGVPGAKRQRLPLRLYHRSWAVLGHPTAERLTRRRFDVLHSLDLVAPPTAAPLVVTLHDLAALQCPELHAPEQRALAERQLARARDADVVLAVSATTAAAAVAFGIAPERVVVTYPGATMRVRSAPPANHRVRYLLFVGESRPRKNIPFLVRAFLSANLPRDVLLVLAGTDQKCLQGEGVAASDRVRFLGQVSDAELGRCYAGALALVFPSLAEGFGSPVAEALANGVPVVASDIPVMREVTGGVALLADPTDEPAWRSALEQIVHEPALRQRLGEEGAVRGMQFDYRRTAEQTLAAYRKAASCAS